MNIIHENPMDFRVHAPYVSVSGSGSRAGLLHLAAMVISWCHERRRGGGGSSAPGGRGEPGGNFWA